jgi:AraC-like DNA-binding protein
MDALSETLSVVRLSGAIFFNGRFTAPWCYASPPAHAVAPILDPDAEQLIVFHMITEGECVAVVEGLEPVRLSAGDVVMFPGGHGHSLCSAPGVPPDTSRPLADLLAGAPRLLCMGGGGAATRFVCGFLGCDARLGRMLLGGMPPVVRVSLRDAPAGAWLEASLRYALDEAISPRPGGQGVLAKLSELLFVEVLRTYMDDAMAGRTGWLAGLRDRAVGAALNALHADPARAWTLSELARAAGASRSVLAERFQRLIGVSPMQYLTQWRMVLAANLLIRRGGDAQLLDVAMDVGYRTDTAFSRAFRREFGAPPAAWRRARAGRRLASAA